MINLNEFILQNLNRSDSLRYHLLQSKIVFKNRDSNQVRSVEIQLRLDTGMDQNFINPNLIHLYIKLVKNPKSNIVILLNR